MEWRKQNGNCGRAGGARSNRVHARSWPYDGARAAFNENKGVFGILDVKDLLCSIESLDIYIEY